jgi:hypothetical protein
LERLGSGEVGARCKLFEARTLENLARSATVVEEGELAVICQTLQLPWRLELAEGTRAARHADIQRAARELFERSFKPVQHPITGEAALPRTRDASWSPVVEIEEVQLGGPVLWVLLRSHYAPTNEVVEGSWLIPVADGLVSITLLARDQLTGYRESALWAMRDQQGGSGPSAHPGQAFFDDPAHDAVFPTHSLSRVRAARAWLEDPARGALQVTLPAGPPSEGEQALSEADCAVRVPPRYARLPAGTLKMAPSLVTFTRVLLGVRATPLMLTVWKLEGQSLSTKSGRALRELATQTVERWEQEGVKNIRIDTNEVAGELGPEVHLHVRFEVDEPVQEVQIWFVDSRGAVFRIGCNASAAWDTTELWQDAAFVRASFRRLSTPHRPWWRFGR